MTQKVAFITGASRGIGAESAVALAKQGYKVAITARTLSDGESHDHVGKSTALPGSLEATAEAVAAAGGEALCLRGDILDEESMIAAARATLEKWGRIDLLFNNARDDRRNFALIKSRQHQQSCSFDSIGLSTDLRQNFFNAFKVADRCTELFTYA